MKALRFEFLGFRFFLLLLPLVLFAGLSWAQMDSMRDMMQRMMGDVLPPGIDPELLPEPDSPQAHLVQRYCSQCHNLPGPGLHIAAEWPAVVERMYARMRMMQPMMGGQMGIFVPNDGELKLITEYLKKHAQRPIDPENYPNLDSPPGRAYRDVCSQCHVLPDPRQHTRDEWPGVVARMRQNMSAMHKQPPSEAAIRAIVEFLQNHARPGG